MDDESRQKLLRYLPLLVDTVNPELEVERAQFLAKAAKERFVPMAGKASASEIWDEYLNVLMEAIELDPNRVVPQWTPERIDQLLNEFS
jgi:hypothetical protein